MTSVQFWTTFFVILTFSFWAGGVTLATLGSQG
jgi:hypothetical protein